LKGNTRRALEELKDARAYRATPIQKREDLEGKIKRAEGRIAKLITETA
jgi:hypothetical protein